MKLLLPVMLGCLLYSAGIGAQPVLAKQNLTFAQVVFASGKAPAGWLVQSWDWAGY